MTGGELKAWREGHGLQQADLASLLGVHAMTVSKWEREVQAIPPFLPLALRTLKREKKLKTLKKPVSTPTERRKKR